MASTDSGASGGLKITLVKSAIGYNQRQKDTVRALGLRKIRQTVLRPNNPQMRGMVFAVKHLVQVEEVDEAPVKAARPARRASKSKSGVSSESASSTTTEGRAE